MTPYRHEDSEGMKGETENGSCGTGKEGARMGERERENESRRKKERALQGTG